MSNNKDWRGNQKAMFSTIGASNHSVEDREINDYYATDPRAAEWLIKIHEFNDRIWECACGEGHLSKVLENHVDYVYSSDLIDRGYGHGGINFLSNEITQWDGDIITNPPYTLAQEFVVKALSIIEEGKQVAMFLKLTFLESTGRRDLFKKYPPMIVYVSCARIPCGKNGNLKKEGGSAVAYAWFVWKKGFKGDTIIKWFN